MVTFADDFNRADSTDLGANWVEVSGDWSIVSNQLSPGSAGGTIILRASGAMAGNDNYAQATFASNTDASHGVWCRGNSNITSGYLWRNDGTNWTLFQIVGGSFTSIGSYAAAASSGDVAKVQAVGSTIKAYVNGVERVSVTDTAVVTGTSVGLRSESTSLIRFDDFEAGDVSSGATLGTVSSVETAQTIIGEKSAVLDVVAENSSAQTLSGVKTVVLNTVSEQDSAQNFDGSKTTSFGIAGLVETAMPFVGIKTGSLNPAVEVCTAKAIGREVSRVAQSILNSMKKIIGVAASDESFDLDIILHINSVFSDLYRLGIGPPEGFMIDDDSATWEDFLGSDNRLNQVKTYVHLRVRLLFDPPQTSFLIESLDKQITKLEWCLNVQREANSWTDPFLPA